MAASAGWDLLLGVLTVIGSAIFLRLFWPGRVNVDIANQYLQATGKIPYSDWHAPVMSAVWRILIDITGSPGSLLLLQVGLLAAAAWGIGVLVHRSGAPRWVSLLGPTIMVTPWVVSQMTTLWKDTQMSVAILLAVGPHHDHPLRSEGVDPLAACARTPCLRGRSAEERGLRGRADRRLWRMVLGTPVAEPSRTSWRLSRIKGLRATRKF